jgi:2,4-dienoyl-CoA reductase-like NADH-dependent reductase (Old Yellow Enzyme family)/thioredoxin reductase
MKYYNLLQPLRTRRINLKNRMVITAMLTHYANTDGSVTEQSVAYYEERAKGGWGMQITENFAVSPDGRAAPNVPGLWNDELMEGWKIIPERVHKYGGKVFCQLYHAGRGTTTEKTNSQRIVGPSALKDPTKPQIPYELTVSEIHELIELFGDAARRAKEANFDGVELHCGHGYLLNTFLSPFANKRTDAYGGTLINRARFPMEVLKKVREVVGEDFPISFRISVLEYVTGGIDLFESKVIAKMAEENGADIINCSQAVHASSSLNIPSYFIPKAAFVQNAAEIKKVVKIPVIAVGRINDPDIAELIIESGIADLVAMSRASLADPQLPNKVMAGNVEDIRRCIGCLEGCREQKFVTCMVNPATGREKDYRIVPVQSPKKVFVAGGGVAGCESAIVAAQRGHKVTIYEADSKLGGSFILACITPFKADFGSVINWQKRQLEKYGVDIRLNTPLTKDIIDCENPDSVILATGSKPFIPPIKGINGKNVVQAKDVLVGLKDVGNRVVIIGGGMVGTQIADHLSSIYGKQVIVLEMLSEISPKENTTIRSILMERLATHNVNLYTSTKVKEITTDMVIAETKDGSIVNFPADTVVIATGSKPNIELLNVLKDIKCPVITVGDALKTRTALEAIQEGYEAGLKV